MCKAEQPLVAGCEEQSPHVYAQRPLPVRQAEVALVFIGGFGDEVTGIVEYLARRFPESALGMQSEAVRAYYHWNGGCVEDATEGFRRIADDVAAFRRANPGAAVVLVGHSMGAAAALKVAELQPLMKAPSGIYLVTLDPADRVVKPVRPAGVSWWGNCYVENSRSQHDFIIASGGRWNHCAAADYNVVFDGRDTDEYGHPYIHDNAMSLLMSSGGTPAASLCRKLAAALRAGGYSQRNVAEKPEHP